MESASAEELQARLMLRGLWPSAAELAGEAEAAEAPAGTASLFRQQLRAEVDGTLSASLARRRKRLEAKVELLRGGNGAAGRRSDAADAASFVSAGVQTEGTAEVASTQLLSKAFGSALKGATAATKPQVKAFGPSRKQHRFEDPPEKPLEPTPEASTLTATLESLDRTCSSRMRQIAALKIQLEKCQQYYEESEAATQAAAKSLQDLIDSPSLLKKAQSERLERRQCRVADLKANLSNSKEQAKYFQVLAQQQRAYFLQTERVAVNVGPEGMDRYGPRHRAGIVALVPQPLPLKDEEKLEVWDVGTAIANPYVVDSWPFEPNVMANRCPKEAALQPFAEETEEDLEEEKKRFSNPFRPNLGSLRLPVQGGSDDEEDRSGEDYHAPTGTSRSL